MNQEKTIKFVWTKLAEDYAKQHGLEKRPAGTEAWYKGVSATKSPQFHWLWSIGHIRQVKDQL